MLFFALQSSIVGLFCLNAPNYKVGLKRVEQLFSFNAFELGSRLIFARWCAKRFTRDHRLETVTVIAGSGLVCHDLITSSNLLACHLNLDAFRTQIQYLYLLIVTLPSFVY